MSVDPKSIYYDAGGIETLDIIKAKLTPEQFKGYCLGNVIKYSCRANYKGDLDRDMEKTAIYAKKAIASPEPTKEPAKRPAKGPARRGPTNCVGCKLNPLHLDNSDFCAEAGCYSKAFPERLKYKFSEKGLGGDSKTCIGCVHNPAGVALAMGSRCSGMEDPGVSCYPWDMPADNRSNYFSRGI